MRRSARRPSRRRPPWRSRAGPRGGRSSPCRSARRRRQLPCQVPFQPGEDAAEGVAAVLAPLPAMGLVGVPVHLVVLALDLERLDHLLRHERDDAAILPPVEQEERRLDPLGAIERRATPVELGLPGIVQGPHHPVSYTHLTLPTKRIV